MNHWFDHRLKFRVLVALWTMCVLSACATADSNIIYGTLRLAFGKEPDLTKNHTLNPDYRYLRVTVSGRVSLLVLGYIEPDLDGVGPTQIWYNNLAEVIKLRNGRLVGTSGLPFDWLAVRYQNLPRWDHLAQDKPVVFERIRDLKLLYQFGRREEVMLSVLSEPPARTIAGEPRPDLTWVQESYKPQNPANEATESLPPSYFALDFKSPELGAERVVYSWQCLSPSVCLGLQPWRALDHAFEAKVKP
jgi:hypothetical protein